MLGNTFYHETIRKCVIGFGTLFNDIHITRTDSSGNVVQSMKVPLAFGPKQKFLVRLREDPSLSKSVAITLPRIGFQIGAITYDASRKLNKVQKVKNRKNQNRIRVEPKFGRKFADFLAHGSQISSIEKFATQPLRGLSAGPLWVKDPPGYLYYLSNYVDILKESL